jgi:arginine decarboxylase
MQGLERAMSDTFFVNMSVFQSMPDSWAIGQIFPVMPLQRLNEEPSRRAILADLTCDSDGKICRFLDVQGTKDVLELHPPRKGEPYYLGFFLVGAYQEILGDMHNLFGDTNVVHVDLDEKGRTRLVHVLRGDRVKEVLSYVEYFEEDLLRSLRRSVEDSLEAGRMTYEESAAFWERYEAGLRGYTYLTHQPKAETARTETPQA